MHKKYLIAALAALLLFGCVLTAPQPTVTPAPPPFATATPSPTPPAPADTSPTPGPTAAASPTPAATATTAVQARQGVLAWDWENLEPYREAMRPDFAADVSRFGDAPRYLIEVAFEPQAQRYRGQMRVRYTNQ